MEITKKDVELAAKLSKMRVSEEETSLYEAQLKALFKWVDELAVVDTQDVKLTNVNLSAHMRPDVALTSPALAQTLQDAFPEAESHCAKVKKVL